MWLVNWFRSVAVCKSSLYFTSPHSSRWNKRAWNRPSERSGIFAPSFPLSLLSRNGSPYRPRNFTASITLNKRSLLSLLTFRIWSFTAPAMLVLGSTPTDFELVGHQHWCFMITSLRMFIHSAFLPKDPSIIGTGSSYKSFCTCSFGPSILGIGEEKTRYTKKSLPTLGIWLKRIFGEMFWAEIARSCLSVVRTHLIWPYKIGCSYPRELQ